LLFAAKESAGQVEHTASDEIVDDLETKVPGRQTCALAHETMLN
jgi:hypothetical protein